MYKNVKDYVPKLKEMFPHVPEKVIERIISYGWRMFYLCNLTGCDTFIGSKKYKIWLYCGNLTYDSVKHFKYYGRKLRRKLRYLFKRNKRIWDEYYYTGLNEDEYNELYKILYNQRGVKKQIFKYKNKYCFKLADEAKLFYGSAKCIIKFKYITDLGFIFHDDNLKCRNVSIYLVKDHPDKFENILIENYKYEQLNYEKRDN